MTRKKTDYRHITLLQLIKMEHSDHFLMADIERYHKIVADGGTPVIRYSEFHGVRVHDARDAPLGIKIK